MTDLYGEQKMEHPTTFHQINPPLVLASPTTHSNSPVANSTIWLTTMEKLQKIPPYANHH